MAIAAAVFIAVAQAFNYTYVGDDWPGLCATGEFQSPVNIVRKNAQECDLYGGSQEYSLKVSYELSQNFTITNNGHNVAITLGGYPKNYLYLGSQKYELLQFHCHAFSEHSVDGMFGALEIHFVHANVDNSSELLVLGTQYHLSPKDKANSFLDVWLPKAPSTANTSVTILEPLDFYSQIAPGYKSGYQNQVNYPKTRLYTYPGSLTTPACGQGVTWLVIDPLQGPTMSVAQLAQFMTLISETSKGVPINERLPQPLNGRIVKTFEASL